MKKRDLTKIALLGITSGLLVTSQAQAHEGHVQPENSVAAKCGSHGCSVANRDRFNNRIADDANGQNQNGQYSSDYKLLTEKELKSYLNERGKALYDTLDSDGKTLAIKLASRGCKGLNDCKGQNACKTENNSCKGQGNCKGTSTCQFKDKNDAVKVAAQKMGEKRNRSLNNNQY